MIAELPEIHIPLSDIVNGLYVALGLALTYALLAGLGRLNGWVLSMVVRKAGWKGLTAAIVIGHKKVDALLQQMIHEYLEEFPVLRATVWQFHNGEVFTMGNHSWKITCSHEQVAAGIERQIRTNTGVLLSQAIDLVGPVVAGAAAAPAGCELVPPAHYCPAQIGDRACEKGSHGRSVYRFERTAMESTMTRFMFEQQGICVNYVIALLDGSHKGANATGFVSLQFAYLTEKQMATIENGLCSTCRKVEEIQFLLSNSKRTR